jgi:hypothetical protein
MIDVNNCTNRVLDYVTTYICQINSREEDELAERCTEIFQHMYDTVEGMVEKGITFNGSMFAEILCEYSSKYLCIELLMLEDALQVGHIEFTSEEQLIAYSKSRK